MAEPITISLDLPATNRFLNVLSACIGEMLMRADDSPAQENQVYEIQLAAQEIGSNIVDHAYSGLDEGRIVIRLTYDKADREVAIIFTDTGIPYEKQGAPMLPSVDDSVNGGMGMFLVMGLVDDLNYQRLNETNVWQITKRLS